MPEINSKRNKTNKRSTSPKKKKSNKNKKKKGPISGAGLTWKSTETAKEEKKFSRRQMYMVIGIIFVVFLFVLWAFVDDRPEWQRKAAQKEEERRQNETLKQQKEREARNAALSSYNYADLLNSTSLSLALQTMQSGDDERLMIVAFDDSSGDESGGNVYRLKLFKKMDGIAKRIPKHKLFKRYEAEDIPRFVLFDCGSSEDGASENVCKQIVGENIPNVLIFRPLSQPRTLPNDLKSDRDIISYLYNLMQPAVKYLDELIEAEDFVADDSELHCLLFSKNTDVDAIKIYDEVSDSLRDYGYFGRTRNPQIIESFDLDETQLPTLLIWRTYGENPQIFSGNITNREVVRDFIMNNYIPIFGEFTPITSKRYMKRGLPILWVAHNNKMSDDAFQLLLNSALSIAKRYRGQLTFVQLDVDAQPQIAQNFGLDVKDKPDGDKDEDDDDEDDDDDDDEDDDNIDLPQVFIMNQIAQVKEIVNMDDIEGTIQKVIDEYLLQLRIQRGHDVMPELHDDGEFEDDDDDLEDDDDDDDDEDDYDEITQLDDEQDDEQDDDDDDDTQDKAKTDL